MWDRAVIWRLQKHRTRHLRQVVFLMGHFEVTPVWFIRFFFDRRYCHYHWNHNIITLPYINHILPKSIHFHQFNSNRKEKPWLPKTICRSLTSNEQSWVESPQIAWDNLGCKSCIFLVPVRTATSRNLSVYLVRSQDQQRSI